MASRVSMVIVAALGIGAVAACSGSTGSGSSPGGGVELADTEWTLTAYAADGTTTPTPDGVTADIAFTADRVSGSAGCNIFDGPYTVDESALTIGPLATTMRACEAPASAVESAVLANLAAARAFSATADTLEIFDESGTVILEYEAALPGELGGVTWHATGINNGRGGVESVAQGTDPTLVYDPAGTISGNAGCNEYNGPAVVDGEKVTIGPLVSTRMACVDEAANTQEAAFLAALEATTTFSVTSTTLELRSADGALQVSFAAG